MILKLTPVFRFMTERKFNHQSWFLYYPEEGNTRGAPTQLLRGVEFGIETKALLFKRLCAFAGLHCEVRLISIGNHLIENDVETKILIIYHQMFISKPYNK